MDFNATINDLKAKLQGITGKSGSDGESTEQAKKIKRPTSNAMKPALKILGQHCVTRENILGLEISPHYIRLCQMKSSYGRWSLNQLASSCMENQFTNMDIRMNVDIYVENLQILLKKHHIKTTDVALSIPTSTAITKIINMPDMEEEDLAEAAAMGAIWESMVQLQGGIHEYSVYYKVLSRKIKPSESAAIAEMASTQSNDLDNLLGGGDSLDGLLAAETTSENLDDLLAGNTETEAPSAPAADAIIPHSPDIIIPHTSVTMPSETSAEVTTEELTTSEEIPVAEIAQETAPTPEETTIEEVPAPEEEPNTMDVLFVAAKIADIQIYTDIAQRAGLQPVIVDAQCNALKHAFDTNPDKKKIPEPYAMLEFGPDENYVYIIDGLSVTTFPINISDEDKQLTIHHENNAEALQGFVGRYAEELQRILENYTASHKASHKVYNIFVSSTTPLHVEDTSSQPLINTFVQQMSELMGSCKVSQCTFCNHIEVPAEFAKKVNAEGNLAAWATVVGLATYKLDVFDYNEELGAIDRVNLLPGAASLRKTRATQVLTTLAMAAVFAIVMFASATSYTITSSHGKSLTAEIKTLEPVKAQHATKTEELQKLTIVMGKIKSLDGVTNTLPSNQTQVLAVYKNINKSIPEGVWLADVSFTAPSSVELQGNSINDQNILEFVKKLNESGGFKKVSLKTMEVFEKQKTNTATAASGDAASLKKFTLEGEVAADATADKLEILSGGVK